MLKGTSAGMDTKDTFKLSSSLTSAAEIQFPLFSPCRPPQSYNTEVCDTFSSSFKDSDLICLVTSSRSPLFLPMCQGDILGGRRCHRQSSAPRRVETPRAPHLIVCPHLCVFVSLWTVALAGCSDVTRSGLSGETPLNKRSSHRKSRGGKKRCRGSISNKER